MKLDFNVIVPAAKAGDQKARDQLMENFYAWSITQAKLVVRDMEAAKDVAVGFWEWLFTGGGLDEFDPAKGAFYPWMEMHIRFRAKDAARQKETKLVYYSDVADPDDFSNFTGQVGAMQDLETIASKLRSATQKDVFWRMIEGATAEDIAQELGLSEKRIANVISEVRELIRATVREDS